MILGNEKDSQIQDNPLMKKYFELFRESLSRPNSRLLILGHSLADLHINKIIFDKIKNNGLKFYIWNHSGLDSLMKKLIDTPGYDVELFKKGFIGISNAPLQELLRRDVPNAFTVEFKRIQREFFRG